MSDDDKSFRERVEEIRERRSQQQRDDDKSFRERVEEIRERRSQQQQQQNISLNGMSQEMSQGMSQGMSQSGTVGGGFGHTNLLASHVTIELSDRNLEFSNVVVQKTNFNGQVLYGVSGRPENAEVNGMSDTYGMQQFDQKPLHASRVSIELADEILEFSNVQVQKLTMNGQHLYGITGEPNKRISADDAERDPGQQPVESSPVSGSDRVAEDDSETVVWTNTTNETPETTSKGSDSTGINYCPECSADLSTVDSPSFCHECGRDLSNIG